MATILQSFKDLMSKVKSLITRHNNSMSTHANGFDHNLQIVTGSNPAILLKNNAYVYGQTSVTNVGDFTVKDANDTTLGSFGIDSTNTILAFYIHNAHSGGGLWYNCPYDTATAPFITTEAYLMNVCAYDPTAEHHVANKKYVDERINTRMPVNPVSIEFYPGSSAGYGGFLDFHFNNSSEDYTSRLIEYSAGTLTAECYLNCNRWPTLSSHLTHKYYVDTMISGCLSTAGGTITGTLITKDFIIKNKPDPALCIQNTDYDRTTGIVPSDPGGPYDIADFYVYDKNGMRSIWISHDVLTDGTADIKLFLYKAKQSASSDKNVMISISYYQDDTAYIDISDSIKLRNVQCTSPNSDYQIANKKYIDDKIAEIKQLINSLHA